jgi:hypothetical protein
MKASSCFRILDRGQFSSATNHVIIYIYGAASAQTSGLGLSSGHCAEQLPVRSHTPPLRTEYTERKKEKKKKRKRPCSVSAQRRKAPPRARICQRESNPHPAPAQRRKAPPCARIYPPPISLTLTPPSLPLACHHSLSPSCNNEKKAIATSEDI